MNTCSYHYWFILLQAGRSFTALGHKNIAVCAFHSRSDTNDNGVRKTKCRTAFKRWNLDGTLTCSLKLVYDEKSMKYVALEPSCHEKLAATQNITETDRDRIARTENLCGVKLATDFKRVMRFLAIFLMPGNQKWEKMGENWSRERYKVWILSKMTRTRYITPQTFHSMQKLLPWKILVRPIVIARAVLQLPTVSGLSKNIKGLCHRCLKLLLSRTALEKWPSNSVESLMSPTKSTDFWQGKNIYKWIRLKEMFLPFWEIAGAVMVQERGSEMSVGLWRKSGALGAFIRFHDKEKVN